MFCRNCGSEMHDDAVVCVKCGLPTGKGFSYCNKCGGKTHPQAVICVHCGCSFVDEPISEPKEETGSRSKLVAGILGIVFGAFGIHNFYLGFNKQAGIQLGLGLAGLLTCGITTLVSAAWGVIEGIQILSGSKSKDTDGKPLIDDLNF